MKVNRISGHVFLKRVTTAVLLLTLAACSSTQGPVVIRESSAPVGGSKSLEEEREANVQPVLPDHKKTTLPLVEKLITRADVELKNKQYEKAINLAEKGLRIDRKEPRLYLVLSKAYRGELNNKQSVYFAKQGLRYAEKSGAVYQALKKLSY